MCTLEALLAVLLLVFPGGASSPEKGAAPLPAGTIQMTPDSIPWTAGSASLPPNTQVAVIEGDPKKEGIFTMRLKLRAGVRILPHWHPRDERVTVISGAVSVGFGDSFDSARLKRFPAGSFYVTPAMSRHFLSIDEETVLQLTGMGPWELNAITPFPDKKKN